MRELCSLQRRPNQLRSGGTGRRRMPKRRTAGDSASIQEILPAAGEAVAEQIPEPTAEGEYAVNVEGVEELVADKGYHVGPVLAAVREAGVRTYVAEPD